MLLVVAHKKIYSMSNHCGKIAWKCNACNWLNEIILIIVISVENAAVGLPFVSLRRG